VEPGPPVTAGAASPRPAWSLSEVEFREVQREIIRDALTELLPTVPTPLLTLEETAEFFRCSTRHIRRLRREGLPAVMLGESPRFERDAVLAWLRSRSVK
jgi:excisionase family DNA binding protein